MAEPSIVVERFSEHIGKGCPHCKRGIEAGQTIVLCPRCKTVHHEDCWYNAGGCGRVGCRGVASARPQSPQASLAQAAKGRASGEASAAESPAPAAGTAPGQATSGQLPIGAIVGVVVILLILAAIWLLR